MTTYNTGNPIGSTDARDRLDNSENMDILENSVTLNEHPDRLGRLRKTRKGMELEHDNQISAHEAEHDAQISAHEAEHDAQISAHEAEHDAQMQSFENDFDSRLAGMAFTRVGTFTTGATLTDMRQTLLWEVSQGGDGHEYGWTGSFPKVVSSRSTPATSGGIGAGAWVDRTDVTLRDEVRETTFQTMKRSYAEAGFNLVDGSFQMGGSLSGWPDVLWDWATGVAYQWHLDEAKTIPSGSTPATTGGIGAWAWVDRSSVTARSSLAEVFGAALVNTSTGETVEDRLSGHDTDITNINNSLSAITNQSHSFRNKIIDGRFDFWYEGTSQTSSGYGSSTMWNNTNTGSTKTTSRQTLTPGVDLPAIECPTAKYFHRTVVTSVAGANNNCVFWQNIEDVKTLAGKTVTLSFYAKSDATRNIAIDIGQYFGTSGSTAVDTAISQIVSLSTSWKRYFITGTLPSVSGKTISATDSVLGVDIWFDAGTAWASRASSLGQQSGTFDIACIQLEEGSVATPFEELPIEISQMRVNRYFWKTGYIRRDIYASWASDDSFIDIKLPTTMRASPSVSVTGFDTTLTGITYLTTNLDFIVVYATGGIAGGNNWSVSSLTADARL